MIILSTTSDKVQVVLGGSVTTNQLKCFVSYTDTTTTSVTPGRNALVTNNTTPVDLVTSPASSTQRLVSYLSVYNSDTVSSTVTINLYTTSTTYKLITMTLSSGERIEYQQGEGFKVFATNGSFKTTPNSIGSPFSTEIQHTMLNGDVSVSTTSYSDVTGLSFPVLANKRYYFKFDIITTSQTTAVGQGWSINGPTFSNLMYYSFYAASATAALYNNGVSTYNTGTVTANNATRGIGFIEGIIDTTSSGNVIASARSESNGLTVTAKAGSVVFYQQLT
jgi:hypothetical protein